MKGRDVLYFALTAGLMLSVDFAAAENAKKLISLTNKKRRANGIKSLKFSEKGSQMAAAMARNLAESGTIKKSSDSSDSCHASYASLGHSGSSMTQIFNEWWKKQQKELLKEDYSYSGVGVVTRNSGKVVYAVQLLCGYDFVDHLTVQRNRNRVNAIRTDILSMENKIRASNNMEALVSSSALGDLVQKRVVQVANTNKLGLKLIAEDVEKVCKGNHIQLGTVAGTSVADVLNQWNINLMNIESNAYLYTGIGAAFRNDGAIFVMQLLCSKNPDGAETEKRRETPSERFRDDLFTAINEKRVDKGRHELKSSSLTAGDAQTWAENLSMSGEIKKDPSYKRGCDNFNSKVYQSVTKTSEINDILDDQDQQQFFLNNKVHFVGIGVESKDNEFFTVMNFCSYKPSVYG
uniref:SCP domain-containing protein n=1 Tax=Corethron hystrix TaxID=216773 RepID=A0A6U5E4R5_9STRA|mmetsp:Transcript_15819/g.35603  ORF Transcript_15819/g.35603 Transcript_15819/m.35603 type:complete len:406 (+) Transcript_15819:219-1436(+)